MSESPGYGAWKASRDKLCAAWRDDGELFMAECFTHQEGHQSLVAIDESEPIGPDNFEWVYTFDLGLEIDGEWHPSREAQEILGVSRETVRQRRNVQLGLCRCGKQEPSKGFKSCDDCRAKGRLVSGATRTTSRRPRIR